MVAPMTESEVREAPLAMLVLQLEDERAVLAEAKRQLAEHREQFEQDHKSLIGIEGGAKDEVARLERTIKERGATEFAVVKYPAPGLTNKTYTVLDYKPSEALGWAKEHRIALKLDTKAFEGIAKAEHLDFVEIYSVVKTTIATDLSEAAAEIAASIEDEGPLPE